jgi:hypothetical protein
LRIKFRRPQELGCGSGVTCWRRLREWEHAGVWHRLHRVLLDRLGEADAIDWSLPAWMPRVSRPKGGRCRTASRSQSHRPRQSRLETPPPGRPPGHPARGLAHGANVHDSLVFEDLIEAVEPIKRPRGRLRQRPAKLHADKAQSQHNIRDMKCKVDGCEDLSV